MFPKSKYFEQTRRERAISPFIPYSSVIAPNTILTREGDYLRLWKLAGVPFETVDPDDVALWKEQLNTLFRSLGSEHVALYTHQIRRETSDRLDAAFPDGFSRALDEKYYGSFDRYRMMQNELYLTLVYRPYPSKAAKSLARAGRTLETLREEQAAALRALDELAAQVTAGLSRYAPRELTSYRKGGITFSAPLEFLNFLLSGEWQRVRLPRIPLSDYLGTAAVICGLESLELRGPVRSRYARMLDLKDYPPETEPGMLDGLLYTDFEYVLTQSFSFLPRYKGKDFLEKQQKRLLNAEDAAASQIAEMTAALDQLVSGEFVMGEYHASLLVFGDEPERLRKDTTKAQTLLQDQGFLPAAVSTATDAAFFAQQPAAWKYRPRIAHLTSKNFASLSPFHNYASGKRDRNPWGQAVTLLKTPSGQPFYFNFHEANDPRDCFDEKLLGNTRVIGQSGAGKTVLLTFLLCQAQKFRHQAPLGFTSVFFDKDRGAELAIRALGGRYLALETGRPTGLNPFQLPATEENLQFLERLVELLVSDDGFRPSPADKQRISAAVRTVMGFEPRHRRLALVPQNMTEGGDREGSVVARLARWWGDGPLAWVFDNESDALDFDTHANYGIDGTAFLDHPAVRTPIAFYLLHRMEKALDGRRFLYFMDEFWKWLKDPAFSDFAFNKQKTIRKQNGLGVFATQSPSDVLASEISRAIIEQCATEIYLPNPKASRAEYLDGFGLTEAELEILTEFDEGSRLFLVKQGHVSAVAQLNLAGFSRELALLSGSTDNVALLHAVMAEVGEDPNDWLPVFHQRREARQAGPQRARR